MKQKTLRARRREYAAVERCRNRYGAASIRATADVMATIDYVDINGVARCPVTEEKRQRIHKRFRSLYERWHRAESALYAAEDRLRLVAKSGA
jgi:hypothetical protein